MTPMPKKLRKVPKGDLRTGIRLRPDDRELVNKLNNKLGLDFTALVRLALRRLAETESVVLHKTSQ